VVRTTSAQIRIFGWILILKAQNNIDYCAQFARVIRIVGYVFGHRMRIEVGASRKVLIESLLHIQTRARAAELAVSLSNLSTAADAAVTRYGTEDLGSRAL
jgi:hypothetical protein